MRWSQDSEKLIQRDDSIQKQAYRAYRHCAPAVRGFSKLGQVLDWLNADRVLVVIDPFLLEMPEMKVMIRSQFSRVTTSFYSDFSPYPSLDEVRIGLRQIERHDPQILVAIGGGSSIDMAKLMSVAAGDPQRVDDTLVHCKAIEKAGPPVIAVPTTAGTGAEITHFSAMYIDSRKVSIASPTMRPIVSILDPKLTETMPPGLTAATGLDAICQAVESLWSVRSTAQSRVYAKRALKLGLKYLPIAVHHSNLTARRGMMNAAYLAGRAIDLTTTTACHAMSYVLTQKHGIPHGHAVALTIPAVLRLNANVNGDNCIDPRGPEHTRWAVDQIVQTMGARDVEDAAQKFERFMEDLGCERYLNEFDVVENDLDRLVDSVDVQRLSNNPRTFDRPVIDRIFRSLLDENANRTAVAT